MEIQQQIEKYLYGHPEQKQSEMRQLHHLILQALPGCRLWFDDGTNDAGKTVANPTIGYGFQVMKYANGKTRDFFRIGMRANTTGISVYILGIKDKGFLAKTFGKNIGKANVTGYCIKFKTLKDINIDTLMAAIEYGAIISD